MQKAYTRITWVNYPQTTTPLNDVNLNKVDVGLDTVDDRVVAMDTTKANQSDLLTCVASISLDSATGIMTITLKNGTSTTIDTKLEKIAINFDYDDDPTSPHYQQLVIELDDGTYKYVDMSALVTQYEFTNTSTIAWTVGVGGVITADVVDGSITAQKLQPNYLADVTAQAGIATAAAGSASADATLAESWAIGGTGTRTGEDTNNAKYWSDQAQAVSNAVSYTPQVLTTSEKAQARDNIDALDEAHANEEIASVNGAHGFRYNNNVLEYYDSVTQAWVEVPTATKYALANPTSVSVGVGDTKLVLTWTDPSDLVIGGTLAAEWAGTKIIRKVGSAPTDENDGTLVVNETTRNQYSSNGYEDTGLTNGTTYYYGFFPYTTDGVYNYNVTDDGTPTQSTVTVTLSIESAASDTVAITDSNGNAVVGSPIVTDNTGSGSGTVTIVPNEVYTFTSSVAQRIDGQAGYYSKNVTLTNSLSQSVNVFPDKTFIWCRNFVKPFVIFNRTGATPPPTITETGNYIAITSNDAVQVNPVWGASDAISATDYTAINILGKYKFLNTSGNAAFITIPHNPTDPFTSLDLTNSELCSNYSQNTLQVMRLNISNKTPNTVWFAIALYAAEIDNLQIWGE